MTDISSAPGEVVVDHDGAAIYIDGHKITCPIAASPVVQVGTDTEITSLTITLFPSKLTVIGEPQPREPEQ